MALYYLVGVWQAMYLDRHVNPCSNHLHINETHYQVKMAQQSTSIEHMCLHTWFFISQPVWSEHKHRKKHVDASKSVLLRLFTSINVKKRWWTLQWSNIRRFAPRHLLGVLTKRSTWSMQVTPQVLAHQEAPAVQKAELRTHGRNGLQGNGPIAVSRYNVQGRSWWLEGEVPADGPDVGRAGGEDWRFGRRECKSCKPRMSIFTNRWRRSCRCLLFNWFGHNQWAIGRWGNKSRPWPGTMIAVPTQIALTWPTKQKARLHWSCERVGNFARSSIRGIS